MSNKDIKNYFTLALDEDYSLVLMDNEGVKYILFEAYWPWRKKETKWQMIWKPYLLKYDEGSFLVKEQKEEAKKIIPWDWIEFAEYARDIKKEINLKISNDDQAIDIVCKNENRIHEYYDKNINYKEAANILLKELEKC